MFEFASDLSLFLDGDRSLLGDLALLSALDECREDLREECRDLKLFLSDSILPLLLGLFLSLLAETALGDLLGVAVPGLGVRLLFEVREGLLLLLPLLFLLLPEFADLLL